MSEIVTMPQLGETVTEGTILRWLVQVGDEVKEDDPILEISTDKVDTRARGRLVSLNIENDAAGETWRYGTLRLDAQPDGRR